MVDPNQHDRFVLKQKITPMVNRYEFSASETADDGDGEPFCFVEQKRMKFKEDIRFFTDSSKSHELLRILARQRFDPRARYDVTAPDGKVGEIQKVFGKSLLRSTYALFDAGGREVAQVRERNLFVALLRRLLGDYANIIPIPYDFEFRQGDRVLGHNRRRRFKFRDTYELDFSEDSEHLLDRRLVLAAAVGMDALQAR